MNEIGIYIKSLRKKQNLKLVDLLERSKMSKSYLYRIVYNTDKYKIKSDDIFRLAKILNIDPIEFFMVSKVLPKEMHNHIFSNRELFEKIYQQTFYKTQK